MTLRSVICFFAHPDDETVLAGGIINLLARQKINVHIVCATRGEGGETGEPLTSTQRHLLGSVREQELRCAAQALGATLTVLDYVDPTIGEDEILRPFDVNFDTLARQFATLTAQHKADVVLTHGADGEYGHPAHQLVHRAVVGGLRNSNTLIYTVAANVATVEDTLWNKNQPAHLALDIRPWADAKLAAMQCHATQHALFMRRKKLQNLRDALRTVESVRRVHPETLDEAPQDAFAVLLRTAGAWTPA